MVIGTVESIEKICAGGPAGEGSVIYKLTVKGPFGSLGTEELEVKMGQTAPQKDDWVFINPVRRIIFDRQND